MDLSPAAKPTSIPDLQGTPSEPFTAMRMSELTLMTLASGVIGLFIERQKAGLGDHAAELEAIIEAAEVLKSEGLIIIVEATDDGGVFEDNAPALDGSPKWSDQEAIKARRMFPRGSEYSTPNETFPVLSHYHREIEFQKTAPDGRITVQSSYVPRERFQERVNQKEKK